MAGSGLITGTFFSVLHLALFALALFQVYAFVDAAIRPARAYTAAGKLTKVAWMIILAIGALYDLKWGSVTSIITIAATVAAIVYMVDVRPAIRQFSGKAVANRRNDGPYGPW
jgi:uncharacterized membrane protein YdjX (TVP38/TMEM64 family)